MLSLEWFISLKQANKANQAIGRQPHCVLCIVIGFAGNKTNTTPWNPSKRVVEVEPDRSKNKTVKVTTFGSSSASISTLARKVLKQKGFLATNLFFSHLAQE